MGNLQPGGAQCIAGRVQSAAASLVWHEIILTDQYRSRVQDARGATPTKLPTSMEVSASAARLFGGLIEGVGTRCSDVTTDVMLHALLTVLAYTPHTAINDPPRRPVRAWASCTAAGAELADQPAAPAPRDESVSSHLPPLPILLRTDNYIFVAKPANTVVHRGRFTKQGDVPLLQRLRDQLGVRVNPVNRLEPNPHPSPHPHPHPSSYLHPHPSPHPVAS